MIRAAGGSANSPFAGVQANRIECRFAPSFGSVPASATDAIALGLGAALVAWLLTTFARGFAQ